MPRLLICLAVLSLGLCMASPSAWQERIVGPAPLPSTTGVTRDAGAVPSTREMPVGTAEISGVVTAAGTGRPLANVRLTLSGSTRLSSANAATPGLVSSPTATALSLTRTTVSDGQGRFTFDALPAGGFILNAIREQYLAMAFGARGPGRPGTMIPIADGQRLSVPLALPRGGVITGTVFSPDGEPLAGAQVRSFKVMYANGLRRPQGVSVATTDDRGIYRIANLSPGEYFVSAAPNSGMASELGRVEDEVFHATLQAARQNGRTPQSIVLPIGVQGRVEPPQSFVPTYHPSAVSLGSASVLTLAAGDERASVDITVLPLRGSNISGIVVGAPPNTGIQVTIVNDDPLAEPGPQFSARVANDGTFALRNFVPGQYTIYAQVIPGAVMMDTARAITPSQIDPASRLWALASLSVDGQNSQRVVLTLQPPRTVSGSVAFDASAPRRSNLSVTIGPSPASRVSTINGPLPQAPVAADGTFTVEGVPAGTYAVRASGSMKSVLLNGRDLLDFPLVVEGDRDISGVTITMGDRRSELHGRLTDAAGAGAPDYTIVVAAADRRYWTPGSRRILTTRPDLDGRYAFSGLPPGDYLVAAVTDLETGQQFDQEFLSGLANAAVRVTITEGGTQVQDLRIAR